ncbi:MAG: carbohydrate kinase family protein [Eubacteriales bacterium]
MKISKRKKALIAGTCNLDIVPGFPETYENGSSLISEGKAIYLDNMRYILGGLVSNTGIAMDRLGADVVLSCRVGDDGIGNVVVEMMKKAVKEPIVIVAKDEITASNIVVTTQNMDRVFWLKQGASQNYNVNDMDDLLNRVPIDLFHFGYPTGMKCMFEDGGERLSTIYQHVHDRGITTTLDLSLPGKNSESSYADWKSILKKTLPHVDVFLPSIEETLFIFRRKMYDECLEKSGTSVSIDYIDMNCLESISKEILEMGVKVVVLKLGKFGLYVRTADKEKFAHVGSVGEMLDSTWYERELLETPYVPEPFISTNGTGDAAIGGFLTGMLQGYSIEDTLKLASGTAATRIQSKNGSSDICSCEEIMRKASGGWSKISVDLKEGIWTYNHNLKCYMGKNDKLM